VIAAINAITPTADIELSDIDAIEAARESYEALSVTQKALVTNYNDLFADEARLAVLLAEINAVIIAIKAIIPTADLTVEDEDDVKAASVLYDALTEEQKALVTNYPILVADEEKLVRLFD
jgi:peptidoglycan hydrolase CwlO-like protein